MAIDTKTIEEYARAMDGISFQSNFRVITGRTKRGNTVAFFRS